MSVKYFDKERFDLFLHHDCVNIQVLATSTNKDLYKSVTRFKYILQILFTST